MRRKARFFIIILSCMVLLSAIRGGLFFSYYLINPTQFITLFCENKTNTQKHCDGKCFLAKVSSENTSEQTDVKFDFTKHQIEVFYVEIPTFESLNLLSTEKNLLFYYHFSTYKDINRETLRPPISHELLVVSHNPIFYILKLVKNEKYILPYSYCLGSFLYS